MAALLAYLPVILFMVVPISSGVIESTVSSASQGQFLKDRINTLNKLNDSNIEYMKKFINNTDDITEQEREEIQKINDKYSSMSDIIDITLNDFNEKFKKTQIIIIVLIVVVFFLLLLKNFDLLRTFNYILIYPFIFIYEKISGNKIKF